MNRKCLLFVIVLLPPTIRAQYKACTQEEVPIERVRSTCMSALPWTSIIWMPDSSGNPCYCKCDELASLSLAQFGILRDDRHRDHVEKARTHTKNIPATADLKDAHLFNVEVLGPVNSRSASVTNGQLIEMQDVTTEDLCGDMELLRSVLQAISATGLTSDFSVLIGNSVDLDLAVPHVTAIRSDERDTFLIEVPELMLSSETVGSELLAFMILHELGHCYLNTGSECEADHWAANVGMRALYPGPGLINALEEAVAQFLRYQRSIRNSPEYIPGPYGDECGADAQYPDFGCRESAIRLILQCLPSTAETCSGYDRSCFEQSRPRPPIDVAATICSDSEVCGYVGNEERRTAVEILLGISGAKHYGSTSQLCSELPGLCRKVPGIELKDLLKSAANSRRNDRSIRKMTKRLTKGIRKSMERR